MSKPLHKARPKSLNPERDAQIVSMRRRGVAVKVIAATFQLHHSRIIQIAESYEPLVPVETVNRKCLGCRETIAVPRGFFMCEPCRAYATDCVA